jgi:hypothetical protein
MPSIVYHVLVHIGVLARFALLQHERSLWQTTILSRLEL